MVRRPGYILTVDSEFALSRVLVIPCARVDILRQGRMIDWVGWIPVLWFLNGNDDLKRTLIGTSGR
jgi:hypothetical protein